MKQLVPSILFTVLGVTSVTFTANLSHSQADDSHSGTNPVSPATAPDIPGAQKTPLVQNPPSAQNTPAKVPLEAEVLSVEVKDPKDTEHKTEVALGKYVIVTLNTELTTARQQQTPTNKLGLFINDLFIKGLEPLPVPDQPKSVMFQLKRTDDNGTRGVYYSVTNISGCAVAKQVTARAMIKLQLQWDTRMDPGPRKIPRHCVWNTCPTIRQSS